MRRCRPVVVRDEPVRVNLFNYEQRLQKYRTLFALLAETVLSEIDQALADMRAERKARTDKPTQPGIDGS